MQACCYVHIFFKQSSFLQLDQIFKAEHLATALAIIFYIYTDWTPFLLLRIPTEMELSARIAYTFGDW